MARRGTPVSIEGTSRRWTRTTHRVDFSMPPAEPQVAVKVVELPTGSKLHTERWHTGIANPSRTILCLHGLGGTTNIYYPITRHLLSLPPDSHVLSYDRAGSGLSPLTDYGNVPFSMAHMLADLEAFIASEVSTGPIILVGHSMGTMIISRWLLTSSPALERVSHVIFIGGPMEVPVTPDQHEFRLRLADAIALGGPTAMLDDRMLPLLTGKTTTVTRPLVNALMRAIVMSQRNQAYAATIHAFAEDSLPAAGPIDWDAIQTRFKVLFLCGEEDLLVGVDRVVRLLTRSTVRIMSEIGQ